MPVLELVKHDHPILRQKLDPFDFSNMPRNPNDIARDLADTMLGRGGIGLASNQVGMPYRAFVLWSSPIIPAFNPRITDYSTETVLLEEACLSFPGLTVTVRRPRSIRARYQLPNGEVVVRRYEGMTARAFQHELDHLDGKMFFASASRAKLEAAIRRANKAGHRYTFADLMGKKKFSEAV